MDLTIIIVNWNSKEYLQKCIASIFSSTRGIEFEIIVIDNASFDGCGEMLQKSYPQVRFIQSDRNLGFAKANNETFKESRGRNILFLNPDTEVVGSAIEILHHKLNVLPHAGIVGAKVLNRDCSIQTCCIHAFPSIMNQFLDSDFLRNLFPHSNLWGNKSLFRKSESDTEVDAIGGACLMIKRSVFEEISMFSTDYFMYSEDIDLCYKVWKAGWKTYYVPTAKVIHHGGVSSSQSSVNTFSIVMMLESRWRFFQKTRSMFYCWMYRLATFYASLIRIGLIMLVWPSLGMRGRASSLKAELKRWIARLRWTLGLEKWIKNY